MKRREREMRIHFKGNLINKLKTFERMWSRRNECRGNGLGVRRTFEAEYWMRSTFMQTKEGGGLEKKKSCRRRKRQALGTMQRLRSFLRVLVIKTAFYFRVSPTARRNTSKLLISSADDYFSIKYFLWNYVSADDKIMRPAPRSLNAPVTQLVLNLLLKIH